MHPPKRIGEYNKAYIVAIYNLGEFIKMDGNIVEAKKKFKGAKSVAKAIGF